MKIHYHIKIGNRSWCGFMDDLPASFYRESEQRGIDIVCAHSTQESAMAMVGRLKEVGIDARAVEGHCDESGVIVY